jgi:GxxExxY protein
MLTRVGSPLSPETEALVRRLIACALEVHSELGPGYLESVYRKAMIVELQWRGIAFETEHRVQIVYKGQPIHGHRVDLVVERQVVVELKSVDRLHPVHIAQVASYLRALKLRVGLVMNFNAEHLRGSIRRVVL